jgi:hypothetical protein
LTEWGERKHRQRVRWAVTTGWGLQMGAPLQSTLSADGDANKGTRGTHKRNHTDCKTTFTATYVRHNYATPNPAAVSAAASPLTCRTTQADAPNRTTTVPCSSLALDNIHMSSDTGRCRADSLAGMRSLRSATHGAADCIAHPLSGEPGHRSVCTGLWSSCCRAPRSGSARTRLCCKAKPNTRWSVKV